jgi:hypothetical protein
MGKKRFSKMPRNESSVENFSSAFAGDRPRWVSSGVDEEEEESTGKSCGVLISVMRTVPPGFRTRAASSARSFL